MIQEQDYQAEINWAQVCASDARYINSIDSIDANLVEYGIYYWPQCIIRHSIFSTAEQISSSLAQIYSTDNSKSDYSKTRRIRFFLPWQEGLKRAFCSYYQPKLSINRHGLLLWL